MRFLRLLPIAAIVLGLAPIAAQASIYDWPTYHRDNLRDGNDATDAAFWNGPLIPKWTSPGVGDTIYAEPLLVGNLLIVADLSDTITALNAGTGAVVWQRKVGNPVPNIPGPGFPCGNVSPDGILGTPVVDPVAGIVYAVALEQPANYYLVGLDLHTGAPRFSQVPIAPSGFDPHIQQQRTALSLANGYVYAGFGGYIGDCGPYHGWVVGVPASGGGTQVVYRNDPSGSGAMGAGFWATSGADVDGSGNLYITSGNTTNCAGFLNGETIFKLSASLGLIDWWAPSVWQSLDCADADLGSAGPMLVGSSRNLVFQVGKTGWGYLVNTTLSSPGGNFGNEPFSHQVCSAATSDTAANDQVFGGDAYADPYIYVPCPEGIVALKLAAGPTFSIAWKSASIHPGPPVVAGGIVWAIDTNNGSLYGLDPVTGTTRYSELNLGGVTHFSTPTFGQGRIYVPVDNTVIAFAQPRQEKTGALTASSIRSRTTAPRHLSQTVAGPRPPLPFGAPAGTKEDVSRSAQQAASSPSAQSQVEALMRRITEELLARA